MSKFTHQKKFPRRAKFLATAGVSLATGALSGTDTAFGQKSEEITPFAYHAPQSALDDLKQRLAQARWPEHETTNDWSEGVPLDKLRALVDYWRTDYDWRRCEKALNRSHSSAPGSMVWPFISSTYGRNIRTRCRLSSPMDGPARSSSFET